MNNKPNSLEEHFQSLRNAKPIGFHHSRSIIEASSILEEYSGMAPALRLDASLFVKRFLDFLLLPLLSAGLTIVCVIGTHNQIGAEEWRRANVETISKPYSYTPETIAKIISQQNLCNSEQTFINTYQPIRMTVRQYPEVPQLQNIQPKEFFSYPFEMNSGNDIHSFYLPTSNTHLEKTPSGISFGVRTIGFQRIGNGISAVSNSIAENAAINISYSIDMHQTIGLEIGQESFARKTIVPYTILIGNQVTGSWSKSTIDQQVQVGNLLSWYGAFYRYSFQEINISGVHPFAEVLAGGSTAGLLGKCLTGAEFSPDNSLTFQIAGEASYLNYSLQGTRQASMKQAITAGIEVKW